MPVSQFIFVTSSVIILFNQAVIRLDEMSCCVLVSVFREQYLQGLVRWLDLDESVMPVMGAFLSGLGFEGSDTFLSILQAEPLLAAGATPIIKVLVTLIEDEMTWD